MCSCDELALVLFDFLFTAVENVKTAFLSLFRFFFFMKGFRLKETPKIRYYISPQVVQNFSPSYLATGNLYVEVTLDLYQNAIASVSFLHIFQQVFNAKYISAFRFSDILIGWFYKLLPHYSVNTLFGIYYFRLF